MGFCQSLGLGLLLVAMCANCLLGLWGADVFERVCMSWASSPVALGVAFLLAIKVLVVFSVF